MHVIGKEVRRTLELEPAKARIREDRVTPMFAKTVIKMTSRHPLQRQKKNRH